MAAGKTVYDSVQGAARAITAGELLGEEEAPDGSMTVVVLAGRRIPGYVLCERRHNGWAVIDYDDELDPFSPLPPSKDRAGTTITIDLPVPARTDVAGENSPPLSATAPECTATWFSTTGDEALLDQTASNVGVEIMRGAAPTDTVEVLLRDSRTEYWRPVERGVYWFVRWAVPDPAEHDDDGPEVVAFRRGDGSIAPF